MKNLIELSDVVEINPRIPASLAAEKDRKVTFIPMAGISEGGLITEAEERLLHEVVKGYTYFQRGDVLVAKITPCFENGKAAFIDELPHSVGFGSTEFHVLRPSSNINGRYLFYVIWNSAFRFVAKRNMTGTAGQKRVPSDFLKRYKIPLPPLSEQKRIATILDKADAIRRKRQQTIQLADGFLRSVFLDMFGDPVMNRRGWNVCTLSEVSDIASGVTKGRKFNEKETMFVPYMRVANIQDGHIDLRDVKEIEVLESDVDKYSLKHGDILLTEGGDPDKLGRGAVWNKQITPCIHQNHIFRVRPDKSKILPEYLSSLIGSTLGKRYFLHAAKQTTGIASINMTQLKGFPVLLPPIQLQEKYELFVMKSRQLTQRIEKYIYAAEDLFNSLTQSAFRGEL